MTAFVVVSIVSGALAFRPFTDHKLYCNNATSTACNVEFDGEEVNSQGTAITPCVGQPAPTTYETSPTTSACTQTAKVIAVTD